MAIGKMIKNLAAQAGSRTSAAPTPRRVNQASGGVQPTQATTIRADRGATRENEGIRRRREIQGGADANVIRPEASHTGYRE